MIFLLKVFGVALMLSGGLWALQGLGIVSWPADSFMLAETRWAIIGILTFFVGLAAFLWADRRQA